MRVRGKLAVLGLAALLSVPAVLTAQPFEMPVVTGHATYADMDGLDPCLAAVVGIVRARVLWFGGQVLFERTSPEGSGFVYAVQNRAPDPREQVLRPTGQVFTFTDPNGLSWQVSEYNFTNITQPEVDGGNYTVTPTQPPFVGVNDPPGVAPGNASGPWYTWVVQVGPSIEDFAATGKPYNFVTLVDTCRFQEPALNVTHSEPSPGNWTSSWGNDTTQGQHSAGEGSHTHRSYDVDLYVGDAPRVVGSQDPEFLGVTP